MAFKLSRKAFLQTGAAGVGMLALSACSGPAPAAAVGTSGLLSAWSRKPASVSVRSSNALSGSGWQAQVTFLDPAGYVDDTLAMNSMYSFAGYSGQGILYIEPSPEVTEFQLFVNNQAIDTTDITAGACWAVDISAYTINGRNTIQVSGIQPTGRTITVRIPYPTVIEGTPKDVALDPEVLDLIETIVQADVANGFPGAQMAVVKDGRLVYQNAWGTVNAYNPDGTPKTDSPAVTNETLYDLASNTKMYTVNYALQALVTDGSVDLDSRIVDLLGDAFADDTIDLTYNGYDNPGLKVNKQWKRALTLRDVLRHQAGFPADPQYHNDAFDQTTQTPAPGVANPLYSGSDGSQATREATLHAIFKTPLMYEPGTKTVYSDVDYMLLAFVIESVTGQGLEEFLSARFWAPLGLTHTTYAPLLHGFAANDCAATELNGNTRDGAVSFTGVRTATIQGQVHDEKAYYAMGGVSGHAGLFSTATELAQLAFIMLTGGYGPYKMFSRNVIDTFTAPKKEDAATWGLGWWREADNGRCWYFGTQSSSGTIGHQGWTGTLTLIDPAEDLVLVYLTNKINSPVTDKTANPNKFNGNWYTSSTLGFVPQLLYQGLGSRGSSPTNALSALLADMAAEKYKLVAEAAPADASHPIVRAFYAVLEALFARAQATRSSQDWTNAKAAVDLLDPSRDTAEREKLLDILTKAHRN